jgi:SAM-dependent methyltransferase
MSAEGQQSAAKEFYDREYSGDVYAPFENPDDHPLHDALCSFIQNHSLGTKKVIEIGCGPGLFQDLVDDYVGVDYSSTVGEKLRKPFVQASATDLPFEDNSFDALWTLWVLEHVPEPEKAFAEFRRVLKPGGVMFFAPAWFCRPWAADGYPVRPYSHFGLKGKLIKASIPVRDSLAWRLAFVLPRRMVRACQRMVSSSPTRFKYKKLNPNYKKFWMSDSDAVNSMDPYESIQWFVSRGDECLSHPQGLRRFLVRGGAIEFRIRK